MIDTFKCGEIKVDVQRLDDILECLNDQINEISLIKIDIEGYEPFALKGATKTLSKAQVLVAEFSPQLILKSGIDPKTFLQEILDIFGYMYIFSIQGLKQTSVDECIDECISNVGNQIDIVFLKNPEH